MTPNLKLQEAIEIVKRIDIFEFNNPLKIVISAAQSIIAKCDCVMVQADCPECGGTGQLPKPSEEAKQMTVEKEPFMVHFLDCKSCPDEKIKEYCIMPSRDIVVRLGNGESLWFDKDGKHPKSEIIFKGERR